jgi:hypothetical protein
MKKIIYKEVVEIDGQEFVMKTCDHSQSIEDLISDGCEFSDNQDIAGQVYDREQFS